MATRLSILLAALFITGCASMHQPLKMSGSWTLTSGTPVDSWPDKIVFKGENRMTSTIHGVTSDSYYSVLSGEYIHLFLSKKELSYPKGSRIPFSYDYEDDSLKLLSPAGEEGVYSRDR